MSDRRSRVRSILASLRHWLGRVFGRRFPQEETAEAIGSGEHPPRSGETETVASPQAPPRQPVGQVLEFDGHPPVAVVDLGREVSAALRTSWDDGRPFESGGVIDSVWVQPLFAAGGMAASSLAAGNVFLATANPDLLMVIRDGLGTAIIGEGGRIIGHAQFIPAGGAILPVVAPVMLFMTASSLIIAARLDRMQRTLDALYEVVARVQQVMEAGSYAKFQAAAKELDEIWSQFKRSQRFTDGMKMGLVLARNNMSQIQYQFRYLCGRKIGSENDARKWMADIDLFFLSSLMDIRADTLRLFLTLQDDPGFAEQRQAALRAKSEQTNRRLKTLLEECPIKGFRNELRGNLAEKPFGNLNRRLPRWLGGRLPEKIRRVEAILEAYRPIRERIDRWTSASDSATGAAREQSIVVYRALGGEGALHVRHTRDLRLQRVGA